MCNSIPATKPVYKAPQIDVTTKKPVEKTETKKSDATPTKPGDETKVGKYTTYKETKAVSFGEKGKEEPANITADAGSSPNTVKSLKALGLEKAWTGSIESNKHKGTTSETAILVPKGLDYSKEVKVMYYFHGWGGGIADATTKTKDELMAYAKKHNMVIVIPQGPAQDDGKAKDSWMADKGQFAKFNKDVMGKLDTMLPSQAKVTSVELAGHSAGGVALRNSVAGLENGDLSGGRWKEVKLTKVNFLDASYSDADKKDSTDRAEIAQSALKKINPSAEFHVTYLKNTTTDKGFSDDKVKSPLESTDTKFHPITTSPTRVHETVPKLFFGEYSEK